jgi:iron complex transport system ATP-binding protein
MLRIDKLSYSYGDKRVLEEIDLYIEEGEFIGIIGPNGSGKSTLLKNISNFLKPEAGAIYLNHRILNDYSAIELARQLAVVPQDTYINYNFSVYDLVMMGRNPYQDRWGRVAREDMKVVREAMEKTDIMDFKDKGINQLSGGERQRVIIARALAQKPEILLLDEPTASLDINYQQEIFDLLANLNKELGITIIVVSHDLNLSSQYCSKLILLYKGKINKIGNPEEVLTADNIAEVYQTEVMVEKNPLTDRPYIIMIPDRRARFRNTETGFHSREKEHPVKVHVICGGGTGRKLLGLLFQEGFQVSCGVLNQGDADWETARKLGIEVAEAPPFSPIDKKGLQHNRKLLNKADLIIMTDVPFGNGNLENLTQVLEQDAQKTILYNKRNIDERDFTDGIASGYWKLLLEKKNTITVKTFMELKKVLENFLEE